MKENGNFKKTYLIPILCLVVIAAVWIIDGSIQRKTPTAGAINETAQVVETGNPVKVLSASDWAGKYPEQYASYLKNSENSETIDHVEEYPMISVIYEGMAFNQYYNSARGHVYTIEDLTSTGRPHKLANCITCKTPDFTAMVNEKGESVYSMAFEDVISEINESISCYNCHANTGDELVVTHTYLADAMGSDLSTVDPSTLACAQCHVEYYFNPETKATTLPYSSLASMSPDAILAYYDEIGFSDYENPRTGTKQIKVQHPEFETFMGEGSAHAGFLSCADCHMGTVSSEAGYSNGTVTDHQWLSPFKKEGLVENTCYQCHDSHLEQNVRAIQAEIEERTIDIGNKLEELTELLAAAVADGSKTEDELNEIRSLNRSAQFYWDFVFVENSEGAHNSTLDNDCLDKADALVEEALAKF